MAFRASSTISAYVSRYLRKCQHTERHITAYLVCFLLAGWLPQEARSDHGRREERPAAWHAAGAAWRRGCQAKIRPQVLFADRQEGRRGRQTGEGPRVLRPDRQEGRRGDEALARLQVLCRNRPQRRREGWSQRPAPPHRLLDSRRAKDHCQAG